MKSLSKISNPKGGEVILLIVGASERLLEKKSKSTNLTLKLYLDTNVSNKDCENNENK